jgi:histidinol-phosphate phosphatase family protein
VSPSRPAGSLRDVTTVVVPTVGRPSLMVLLEALAAQRLDAPVLLVDDRPGPPDEPLLPASVPASLRGLDLTVHATGGGGPARARNAGWRRVRTSWVSFLDDDVVPDPDWAQALGKDLDRAEAEDDPPAGIAGRVRVPLPEGRRPTDWERGTAGLATSRWITADLTYRREALAGVGGFDERFPRAFREDADLALRVQATGGRLEVGDRWITHPVRPAPDDASLRQQAGNADDALMRRLHGPDWYERADAPRGRLGRHTAVVGAAATGVAALLTGHRRLAAAGAALWAAGTVEFALARILPGPRDPWDTAELRRMAWTSAAIPFAAVRHRVAGELRHRAAPPWRGVPELVLLDRDDTLVHDVPYNGDPARVDPVDGAREALMRLRRAGVRVAVVSNQSGVGSGRITRDQVDAVNARVEELLGPFEGFYICPHDRDEGCNCRKPAPGLVRQACAALGVPAHRTAVVGDIGSDVGAALAAGAEAVLVPTPVTRREEVAAAPQVAADLAAAVDLLLDGAR